MSNKRECPFTPPSVSMPWMRPTSSPSLLARLTGSPKQSELLQNAGLRLQPLASLQERLQPLASLQEKKGVTSLLTQSGERELKIEKLRLLLLQKYHIA